MKIEYIIRIGLKRYDSEQKYRLVEIKQVGTTCLRCDTKREVMNFLKSELELPNKKIKS
jgi:hypothetical protein